MASDGIHFRVTDWAAWAPGLVSPEDWTAWAQQPFVPHGDGMPALERVPPMQRRRIERLGRAAIQAVGDCRRADDTGTPLVFVSRHGDVARSLALLRDLCAGQAMSPTQFGLSVHNAIAAQYSILQGEHGNYTALAGGHASLETALVEAVGLLADGARCVTLMACDAEVPEAYGQFDNEPAAFFAFAWRLTANASPEGTMLSLEWDHDGPEKAIHTAGLPGMLEAHRFLLSDEEEMLREAEGVRWRWLRP